MRRHLSYANVAATLALIFSMTGGAPAASHYVITSTKQIKPSVLKQLRGKSGPPGPQGPAAALASLSLHLGETVSFGAFDLGSSVASCAAGENVVSGGYLVGGVNAHVIYSGPTGSTGSGASGWKVTALNPTAEGSGNTIEAIAHCGPAGKAVAASVRRR